MGPQFFCEVLFNKNKDWKALIIKAPCIVPLCASEASPTIVSRGKIHVMECYYL